MVESGPGHPSTSEFESVEMFEMKSAAPLLALFVLLVAPAGARGSWPDGENLVAPAPSTEGWDVLKRDEGAYTSTLWERKEAGLDDSYVVDVLAGYNEQLPAFREEQDAPGKKACKSFDSKVLEDSPTQGYPRLVWRTLCVGEKGFVSTSLQVAIQGRERFYHIQKVWRGEVPDQDLARWRERITAISVCDTRDPKRPCPPSVETVP